MQKRQSCVGVLMLVMTDTRSKAKHNNDIFRSHSAVVAAQRSENHAVRITVNIQGCSHQSFDAQCTHLQ